MPNIEFDIDRVSKLAYLSLTDKEKAELQEQLPSIVAYISKLHEVDTSNIDAKEYLTDQQNVFREDEAAVDESERRAVIEAFPKEQGGALEVPAIFE